MEIGERRDGNILVLQPVGRIDNDTSPDFQSRLLSGLTAGATVLVDFSAVEYISSAGLRALMMGRNNRRRPTASSRSRRWGRWSRKFSRSAVSRWSCRSSTLRPTRSRRCADGTP